MKIQFIGAGLMALIFISTEIRAQKSEFIGGLLLNLNGIQIEGQKDQFWGSPTGKIWGGGGISVGAFVKRDFPNNKYGVFEIRYMQKGSIYEFSNQYGNRALETLRLNYMEIPVLMGFKIPTRKKSLYFETGLAYSRMFNSSIKFQKLVERINTPNVENYKKSDFSVITDLKFVLNQRNNLLLGFRVEYSLFSIHEFYKLHNLDYGVEIDYLIFSKQ